MILTCKQCHVLFNIKRIEREPVDDMLVLENWVTRYLIDNIKREQQKISKQKPLSFC